MNTTEKKLISNATNIISDIKKYISSNDNWIFYFINPLLESDANKPIYKIIETYHDECFLIRSTDPHVVAQIKNSMTYPT